MSYVLPILTSLLLPAFARAQSSPLAAFIGTGGPPVSTISVEGRAVNGQTPSPSIGEDKATATFPAYRDDVHVVTPMVSIGHLSLGQDLRLSSGRLVPRELGRFEVGTQYTHQMERHRNWGLRGTLGYAGDKPFRANGDLTFSVAATYGYPTAGGGYWAFMVLMGNNGPLPNYLPLPGFLYVYRTPTFTGVFGLPILSLTWTPHPRWTGTLSAFGPLLRAEVASGPKDRTQTFVAYAFHQQFFIPDDRPRQRDRLTFQEQRALLGVRRQFTHGINAELQTGAVYDRSVYVGRSFGSKKGGAAALPADWFVGWQAGATF